MNDSFLVFLKEQFLCVGDIAIRKMFGGAGIYFEGVMFGLVSDDVVYLKVDATNKTDYEDEGMGPFTYTGKHGKQISMSYYQLPEHVLDDMDELAVWARKAISISRN